MSDWKVGDRVQREKSSTDIRTGAIAAVATKEVERVERDWYSRKETKRMETVIDTIDIQWDDGELETGLGEYHVNREDSEMERAFRLAVDDAQARIDAEMSKAHAAIRAAVAISEETGIPFRAGVSPLSQSYIPNSMTSKFPGVEREFTSEIAGAYGEYEGWQHSAVC